MKMVTKALLLALAVGVACANLDPAQISGPWRTFAMAADNMDMIQEGGPLRMLLRRIECDTGCNALNVFYYDRRNSVCTPHMLVARKIEDGDYITDFEERQNRFRLQGLDPDRLLFTDFTRGPDSTPTRVRYLFVRLKVMNEDHLDDFKRLTEEQGIPRENIRRVGDTDTCPP